VSFRLNPALAKRFHEATSSFYGKIGTCFGAAILLFLEADPKVQGEYIKRIYEAEIADEIDEAIEHARSEQMKKIKAREGSSKHNRNSGA
jgi:hypothetical protein